MDEKNLNRRQVMLGGLAALGSLLLPKRSLAESCVETPKQPLGPFYPVDKHLDEDSDLTWVRGETQRALGQYVYVEGVVQNPKCEPLEGVLVEIWQACESGKYDHPADKGNPSKLDPHFQYWGRVVTGKDGKYMFKTVIPGAYLADENWWRPPHIHYRIQKKGYRELVTQLYFEGERYNPTDLYYKALSVAEQNQVTLKLGPPQVGMDPKAKHGVFNITLKKFR